MLIIIYQKIETIKQNILVVPSNYSNLLLDFFNNTYSGKTQFEPCVLLKYQFGANPNAEPILSSNLTFGENVIVSGPWRRILNHVVPFLFLFSHLLTKQLKRKRQVDFFSLAFSLRVVVNQRYQKKHFGYSILILRAAQDILSGCQCSDDYIYKVPPLLPRLSRKVFPGLQNDCTLYENSSKMGVGDFLFGVNGEKKN